jgi:hypothetical protein
MRKYESLDENGRLFSFTEKDDITAKQFAINNHFKTLIRVKSYSQAGYMYTILAYKQEGY